MELMQSVNARLVWAWTCLECDVVNLMTEDPKPDLEVVCGTGYFVDDGCGSVSKIASVYETPILAVHREVQYQRVQVALEDV